MTRERERERERVYKGMGSCMLLLACHLYESTFIIGAHSEC